MSNNYNDDDLNDFNDNDDILKDDGFIDRACYRKRNISTCKIIN